MILISNFFLLLKRPAKPANLCSPYTILSYSVPRTVSFPEIVIFYAFLRTTTDHKPRNLTGELPKH